MLKAAANTMHTIPLTERVTVRIADFSLLNK